MDSSYIQRASLAAGDKLRDPTKPYNVTFTNLSSQQMFPGALPSFFQNQTKMERMPFGNGDIPGSEGTQELRDLVGLPPISQQPRGQSLESFFSTQTRSANVQGWRTSSQRVWGVPPEHADLRATDFS